MISRTESEAKKKVPLTKWNQSSIYKYFDLNNDIIEGSKWDSIDGIFSTGVNNLTAIYTSSTRVAADISNYFINIYQQDPEIVGAEIQFDISYGNIENFNSGSDTSTYDYKYIPAKTTYYQYRNILLPEGTERFQYADGVITNRDFFVINFKRSQLRENLKAGSWELSLSGSEDFRITLIDNSIEEDSITPGKHSSLSEAYYICSGSLTNGIYETVAAYPYGIVYPELGILILNSSAIARDLNNYDYSASIDFKTTSNVIGEFYNILNRGANFTARSSEQLGSVQYIARIQNKEFNFSNNLSWQTGSYGVIKWSDMLFNPKTYITTVGLYNDNNDLLAIGKLSQPVQKSFDKDINIRIKLDF